MRFKRHFLPPHVSRGRSQVRREESDAGSEHVRQFPENGGHLRSVSDPHACPKFTPRFTRSPVSQAQAPRWGWESDVPAQGKRMVNAAYRARPGQGAHPARAAGRRGRDALAAQTGFQFNEKGSAHRPSDGHGVCSAARGERSGRPEPGGGGPSCL